MDNDSLAFQSIPNDAARTAVGSENVHLILEVAYLLAAMDGVIRESEIVEFRNIARLLLGSRYEDADTIQFFMDIQDKVRRLLDVMKFYQVDEGKINAFNYCVKQSVSAISKTSKEIVRRAFAFWVGMCINDNDYAVIEQKAVESLRQTIVSLNPNAGTFLSDGFMKRLSDHIATVKQFERDVMENPNIQDEEKDERLRMMIEEFNTLVADAS
jgi:hypothetical protein